MTADKANLLRELHRPGDPLILVNVWDVAGARTVAAADGCRAIATASWSIAAAHGYADGEEIPLELMLAAIERIAAAVELPVTADIEAGFGDTPAEVSETVAAVIAAGAVGVNLEDRLRPAAEHAAILAAVRERGEREGVPLVINGRSDEFLLGERNLDEAIARGRAYLKAGADSFFIPGLVELADIRRLVERARRRARQRAGAAGLAAAHGARRAPAWRASASGPGRWASRTRPWARRPRRCSPAAAIPPTLANRPY